MIEIIGRKWLPSVLTVVSALSFALLVSVLISVMSWLKNKGQDIEGGTVVVSGSIPRCLWKIRERRSGGE